VAAAAPGGEVPVPAAAGEHPAAVRAWSHTLPPLPLSSAAADLASEGSDEDTDEAASLMPHSTVVATRRTPSVGGGSGSSPRASSAAPPFALRVLAVDDSASSLRLLERSLTRNGFSVTTADSGERALQLLGNLCPCNAAAPAPPSPLPAVLPFGSGAGGLSDAGDMVGQPPSISTAAGAVASPSDSTSTSTSSGGSGGSLDADGSPNTSPIMAVGLAPAAATLGTVGASASDSAYARGSAPSVLETTISAAAPTAPFDIILLDIIMPGMSGKEWLNIVKSAPKGRAAGSGEGAAASTSCNSSEDATGSRPPRLASVSGTAAAEALPHLQSVADSFQISPACRAIPVIVMSSLDDQQTSLECLRLGADDVLVKPFSVEVVVSRINAVLERFRLRHWVESKLGELAQLDDLRWRNKQMEEEIRRKEGLQATVGTPTPGTPIAAQPVPSPPPPITGFTAPAINAEEVARSRSAIANTVSAPVPATSPTLESAGGSATMSMFVPFSEPVASDTAGAGNHVAAMPPPLPSAALIGPSPVGGPPQRRAQAGDAPVDALAKVGRPVSLASTATTSTVSGAPQEASVSLRMHREVLERLALAEETNELMRRKYDKAAAKQTARLRQTEEAMADLQRTIRTLTQENRQLRKQVTGLYDHERELVTGLRAIQARVRRLLAEAGERGYVPAFYVPNPYAPRPLEATRTAPALTLTEAGVFAQPAASAIDGLFGSSDRVLRTYAPPLPGESAIETSRLQEPSSLHLILSDPSEEAGWLRALSLFESASSSMQAALGAWALPGEPVVLYTYFVNVSDHCSNNSGNQGQNALTAAHAVSGFFQDAPRGLLPVKSRRLPNVGLTAANEDFQRLSRDICGYPAYFSGLFHEKARDHNFSCQGDCGGGLVTPESFLRWWTTGIAKAYLASGLSGIGATNSVNTSDRIHKFWHLVAPPDSSYIFPANLEPLLQALVDSHPDLTKARDDPVMRWSYYTVVVTSLICSLHGQRSGRISFPELRGSNLVDAFHLVASQSTRHVLPFSISYFEEAYNTWTAALHAAGDAAVSVDDSLNGAGAMAFNTTPFGRRIGFTTSTLLPLHVLAQCSRNGEMPMLTPYIWRRIGAGAARPLTNPGCFDMDQDERDSGRKEAMVSFPEFVWLWLAGRDRMGDTALGYWFRCLDADDDGYITYSDLLLAYRGRHDDDRQRGRHEHRDYEGMLMPDGVTPPASPPADDWEDDDTTAEVDNVEKEGIFDAALHPKPAAMPPRGLPNPAAAQRHPADGAPATDGGALAAEHVDKKARRKRHTHTGNDPAQNSIFALIDLINPRHQSRITALDIRRSGAGPALFDALIAFPM
jgi:DNA-binding response OmpR family regulator